MKPAISLFVVLGIFALLWSAAAVKVTTPTSNTSTDITLKPEMFESLKPGMTVAECETIIGCEAGEINALESPATDATFTEMVWRNKKQRYIQVSFRNGRLHIKNAKLEP